jgi:hypothetical protein
MVTDSAGIMEGALAILETKKKFRISELIAQGMYMLLMRIKVRDPEGVVSLVETKQ